MRRQPAGPVLNDAGLDEAFVFFKHEDAGTGPKLAQQFLDIAG